MTPDSEKKNRSFMFENDLVSDDEDEECNAQTNENNRISLVFSSTLGWHLAEESSTPKETSSKGSTKNVDPITVLRSSILSLFVALFKVDNWLLFRCLHVRTIVNLCIFHQTKILPIAKLVLINSLTKKVL